MSARALFLALAFAAPAAAQERTVRGTVVGADGKPAAGVEVANFWVADGGKMTAYNGSTTNDDGTFTVKVPGWMPEAGLLAYSKDRKQGGLVRVPQKDETAPALKLGPTVAVSGRFECPELGRNPGWTNVYVMAGKDARLIQAASEKAEFAFRVPAGEYTFHGYGSDVIGTKKPVTVPSDKDSLDLGAIELKATAVAKMIGKPPLPWTLKDARGADKTVRIEDFKGKWVLLDFWGHWCGPCVHGLAELIDVWEMYADHRDKFVILALHDSSVQSLTEMDEKLVPIKKSLWAGRDLPFPVLLDNEKKTATAYTIQGWPTTLLIDPDGKVVGQDHAGQMLMSKLPKLAPGVRAGRALDKMVGYGIDGTSLDGFAKNMAGRTGVPVKLDEAALKTKGIDPKANIPFKMSGSVSARSWFDLVLAPDGLIVKKDADGLLVTTGEPSAASKAQTECAKHLAHVLAKPLAFDKPAGTLDELAAYFEQSTRENFVLDPAARRAGTLDPATKVPAANGSDKPLRESLSSLLDPLGLEAVARCEVIVIRPKRKG